MRETLWCHEILIPCYPTVQYFSIFFDFSSTAFEIFLFLCAKVDFDWSWFIVQSWKIPAQNGNLLFRFEALHGIIILFLQTAVIQRLILKIELWPFDHLSVHISLESTPSFGRPSATLEFLHWCTKWQSSRRSVELNRRIVLSLPDDVICSKVVIICAHSLIYCLIICACSCLFHSTTAPFGRPSAFFETSFILSFCLTITLHRSLFCPKHNSKRRSLSMLVPRKEWTVTQLTWVYGMVRVPRNLDPALCHCPVLVEYLSVSDLTMSLVVELIELFISVH